MLDIKDFQTLTRYTDSKILMLVIDGLGGLPHLQSAKTELESANIPNLDKLTHESTTGVAIPIQHGITPGSGPGHMSLFGYNPIKYVIGRGVLEAVGSGIKLANKDIAIRGNFCTINNQGMITDRRAGRISDNNATKLIKRLSQIKIDGIDITIKHLKSHRFVLVLRGPDLNTDITPTDPLLNNLPINHANANSPKSKKTATLINKFTKLSLDILKNEPLANAIVLRGFSQKPSIPNIGHTFHLNPIGISLYPAYRGIADILGMKVTDQGENFSDLIKVVRNNFNDFNFFYLHYKDTDSAGEDGDFDKKVFSLEKLDTFIPELQSIGFDVITIAGDHSTPSVLSSHSWHPVPVLINSNIPTSDKSRHFTELECKNGDIGQIYSTDIMPITLAHANKLIKFEPNTPL